MNNISVDTNDLYLIDEENKDYISEENKNDLSEENFSKEIISENKNDLSEENKKLLNEKNYLSKREKQLLEEINNLTNEKNQKEKQLLEEINNLTKEINELNQKEEQSKNIIESLKLNIFLSHNSNLINKKNDNDTNVKSFDESISRSISTNTDTDIISCDLTRSESNDSYLQKKHNSFNTVSNNTFTKNNLQYISFNYLSKDKDSPPLNYKFYVKEYSYYNIDESIKVRGKFIKINNSNITASYIKNNSIKLICLDSERFYNLNKLCIQKAFKNLNFRNYNINPNF